MKFSKFLLMGVIISFPTLAKDNLDAELTLALSRLLPDVEIDNVSPTPIKDLYQVVIGTDVIYITRDGNYVIKGDILDLEERRNLTEDIRAGSRMKILNNINESDYIEFSSINMQDAIYVFTDVDCGYCRKLHLDVPKLNSLGVTVRYLAYPRAGVDSVVGQEMSNVWCAKDRQKALTAAKNREPIEAKLCDDPVAEQYALGQKLGVRGTPAIYLQNGKILPGYMPPDEIIKQLNR